LASGDELLSWRLSPPLPPFFSGRILEGRAFFLCLADGEGFIRAAFFLEEETGSLRFFFIQESAFSLPPQPIIHAVGEPCFRRKVGPSPSFFSPQEERVFSFFSFPAPGVEVSAVGKDAPFCSWRRCQAVFLFFVRSLRLW